MALPGKLGKLVAAVREGDGTPRVKAVRIAQRGAASLGLAPRVSISRRVIVQLTTPPKQFRGLRDLHVRRGEPRDERALCDIDDTAADLVRARLARGDLAFVGELDSDILCHTWFHRGPTPFDEDRASAVAWALGDRGFWSYNGAARIEARTSGVFVRLFQNALREVFELGASSVHGFIHEANLPSLTMHDRMGWTRLGMLTVIAVPGVKWLHWEGRGGDSRRWIARRGGELALAFDTGTARAV